MMWYNFLKSNIQVQFMDNWVAKKGAAVQEEIDAKYGPST